MHFCTFPIEMTQDDPRWVFFFDLGPLLGPCVKYSPILLIVAIPPAMSGYPRGVALQVCGGENAPYLRHFNTAIK